MPSDPATTRRALLRTTGAVGLVGLLAGCIGAATDTEPTDEPTTPGAASTTTTETTETPTETTTTSVSDETSVVRVGPDGENTFAPRDVSVDLGTTVRFVWESDGHNVAVTDQPAGANWQGHEHLEDAGFVHEHVFETPGPYRYECAPHEALGMTGEICVQEGNAEPCEAPPFPTDRVEVGPADDELEFVPGTDRPAEVGVGEALAFVWKSDSHNVVVTSQPEGADWQGHEPLEDAGFETTFTFDVPGRYEFECAPHSALGMTGTLVVVE